MQLQRIRPSLSTFNALSMAAEEGGDWRRAIDVMVDMRSFFFADDSLSFSIFGPSSLFLLALHSIPLLNSCKDQNWKDLDQDGWAHPKRASLQLSHFGLCQIVKLSESFWCLQGDEGSNLPFHYPLLFYFSFIPHHVDLQSRVFTSRTDIGSTSEYCYV